MRAAFVLIGFALLSPVAAAADPVRDEVLSGAARCEGIADNRTWLDCVYGSAQPMRSLLGLAPAPAAQLKLVPPANVAPARKAPIAAAPVTAPRSKQGGFLSGLLGSTQPVASDIPMADYRFAPDRTFTVTLKNGEVYQQEESDLVFAKWTKAPASYRVTVTASADKYILRVKGEPGTTFRVRRK
jgi:hypothetical protein